MRRRALRAFTLTELLVVIAILMILMALLLPALEKARASVNTVRCMTNQKQLLAACTLYAKDNSGQLPNGEDLVEPRVNWLELLKQYFAVATEADVLARLTCPEAELAAPGNLSVGLQYPTVFGSEADPLIYPSKRLAELPPGVMLCGDNDTNTGLILSPSSNTFAVDTDDDGREDSYTIFRRYNDLVFRHQNHAVIGCANGSVRHVPLVEWLDNSGNIWGK